jgi:hypothetical protein
VCVQLIYYSSVAAGDAHFVALGPVGLGEAHMHALGVAGRQVLADVVGPDRQLAVAAVDEHGQSHRARTAQIGERVEGCADGAPGVEHVVDEDDDLVVDGTPLEGMPTMTRPAGPLLRSRIS